jgi:hypothetical protein
MKKHLRPLLLLSSLISAYCITLQVNASKTPCKQAFDTFVIGFKNKNTPKTKQDKISTQFLKDGQSCEESRDLLARASYEFFSSLEKDDAGKHKKPLWNKTACKNAIKYTANEWANEVDKNINDKNDFINIISDEKGKQMKNSIRMDITKMNKSDITLVAIICNPKLKEKSE